ncbi:receptor-like protein kinase FERONIA [Quercus suber]|uniref:receptor-like protein kinase FERONIA n=1 Tax=Quercus suber TaxID=58331 RepID=UPI000CE1E319|nr:receptor-like protein kinase FERONIA [Quercus suber]
MRNLSVLTPIVSIFCIFFLLYQITLVASSTPPPRYVPDDAIITLDCGSATADKSKDMYLRDWTGDFQSKFFPKEELNNLKSNTSKAPVEGTVTKAPYSTARISSSQFTYVFPVTVGPKFVRLHFNPVIYPGFERSKAFFTVKAGSFTLLRNFTASSLVDSLQEKTFFKEFCINAGKDQKLNLTFIPFSTTFYAFVNGIEIVPMPENLYYKPEGEGQESIPNLSGNPFYINDDMALEMVYRLNVAGNLISPTEDTGFFRRWSSDNNYFRSTGTQMPHKPSWKPDYVIIPNYTAPDDVYRSARTMSRNRTNNRLSNLTWGLPVDTGFNYLVRLHFCEIDPNMNAVGQRRFIIYIDSLIAEQEADVILWTEKMGTPVYKDYVVNIRKKGDEGSHNLSIDLHPITTNHYDEAILNGVEVFKLNNSDGNLAGPSEMPPSFPPVPTAKEVSTKKTIFIAIGGGVGFLVLLTSACFMVLLKLRKSRRYGSYHPLSKFWCWRDPYKGKSTRTKASSLPDEVCRHFSLEEIKTATDNFHQELIIGKGGFGNVYKGLIDEGTVAVAIKRLKPGSGQGAREFKTEIEMLSQLRHGHLVSLIGYCNDEGEMILVYEFMSNGTLSEHLFNTKTDPLTWKQRLDICIGAAKGLHYLHTCMKNPIIHRDVKATNILLDDKMGSKVSDFGLSKMGLGQTAVSTVVKGTLGYLDPDYARRQQVTDKSDVYSFGVVLLEVLCGRKALDQRFGQEQLHLANWARKCAENGTIYEIIDPDLKGKIAPECFKVYVEVAENCVRDQGFQRPTMNDVMEKLEFALELQQNADATQEEINPSGDFTYQEVLSFRVSGRTTGPGAPPHINFEPVLESDTNPSLDSESVTVTSRDVFTDNSNITT